MDFTWVGIVGTIAGMIFGYIGYQKGLKDENKKIGSIDGMLNTDIQYIKKRTDEVLLEQKDTNRTMTTISERLTRVEESTKAAHHRVDLLTGDVKDNKVTYNTRMDSIVNDLKDCRKENQKI